MTFAGKVTSPESLSGTVLTICHGIDHARIDEMATQLMHRTAAVHKEDLSRAENMLAGQAHTMADLFAKLASQGLAASGLEVAESYLRLALKAQSQVRTIVQTLAKAKAPTQVAFVRDGLKKTSRIW